MFICSCTSVNKQQLKNNIESEKQPPQYFQGKLLIYILTYVSQIKNNSAGRKETFLLFILSSKANNSYYRNNRSVLDIYLRNDYSNYKK